MGRPASAVILIVLWCCWTVLLSSGVAVNIGPVSILAGDGVTSGAVFGPLNGSTFNFPGHIVQQPLSDSVLYVVEANNHIVRRIDLNTEMSASWAGKVAVAGHSGGDGASAARFNSPIAILPDPADVSLLFVGDMEGMLTLSMTTRLVTEFSGTGPGYIEGDAAVAKFNGVSGMVMQRYTRDLVVVDAGNNRIRGVNADVGGTVLIAGSGSAVTIDDVGQSAGFNVPQDVAGFPGDPDAVIVTDSGSHCLRKLVLSTVRVSTVAGGTFTAGVADGPLITASFWNPTGVTASSSGKKTVYVADFLNNRVRRVNFAADLVTTVVGNGAAQFHAAVKSVTASTNAPMKVSFACLSGDLTMYISGAHSIASVNVLPSEDYCRPLFENVGPVSILAGEAIIGDIDGPFPSALFSSPTGIVATSGTHAAHAGILYVAESGNNVLRMMTLGAETVSVWAGTVGPSGGHVDGVGTGAELDRPIALVLHPTDSTQMLCGEMGSIRIITIQTAAVATLSGLGVSGYVEGIADLAQFNRVSGIAQFPSGGTGTSSSIVVTDSTNNRVRTVSLVDGRTALLAGDGSSTTSRDGVGQSAATYKPVGLVALPAADDALLVSEGGGNCIRRLTASGNLTTYSGVCARYSVGFQDGPLFHARFYNPSGMAVALRKPSLVFVADTRNNVIRRVDTNAGWVSTIIGNGIAGLSRAPASLNAQLTRPVGMAIVWDPDIGAEVLYITAQHAVVKAEMRGSFTMSPTASETASTTPSQTTTASETSSSTTTASLSSTKSPSVTRSPRTLTLLRSASISTTRVRSRTVTVSRSAATPSPSLSRTGSSSPSQTTTRSTSSSSSSVTTTARSSLSVTTTAAASAAPTVTATLSPQYPATLQPTAQPALPIPVIVATAATSSAAVTAVAGSFASPAAALQVARAVGVLAVLRSCGGGPAAAFDQPLEFPRSLMPFLTVGPSDGAPHRGAVIAVFVAVVASILAGLGFGLWRALVGGPRAPTFGDGKAEGGDHSGTLFSPLNSDVAPTATRPRVDPAHVLRLAHMPGWIAVVAMVGLDGLASSLVVLLVRQVSPALDVALAVVAATGCVSAVVFVEYAVRRAGVASYVPESALQFVPITVQRNHTSRDIVSGTAAAPSRAAQLANTRAARWAVFGTWGWADLSNPACTTSSPSSNHLLTLGPVFAKYRSCTTCSETLDGATKMTCHARLMSAILPRFLMLDATMTVCAAVFESVAITVDCRSGILGLAVVNVLCFVMTVAFRPFAVPLKNALSAFLNLLTGASAVLAASAEYSSSDGTSAEAMRQAAASAAAAAAMVSLCAPLVFVLRFVWLRACGLAVGPDLERLNHLLRSRDPDFHRLLAAPPESTTADDAIIPLSGREPQATFPDGGPYQPANERLLETPIDVDDLVDGGSHAPSSASPMVAASADSSFLQSVPLRISRTAEGQRRFDELDELLNGSLSAHASNRTVVAHEPGPQDRRPVTACRASVLDFDFL
jgi:hypothetical protein